jgi:hypothetical protein
MYLKTGIILLSLIFLVSGVSAIPPLPYEFYGNATINATPIPVGTIIVAQIGGVEVGNITVSADGAYGGPGTFDKRLVVNADEKQIGQYITFRVQDMEAAQKVKLFAGESQRLDLTFAPGVAGSIDASITPSQPASTPDIPSSGPAGAEPATEPTQKSPLVVAPVAAGLLALMMFARR